MIVYRQKQYGVLGVGLANLGSGLGAAAGGIVKGAATVGGGLVKAAVPTLTGIGQVGASGLAAGSLGLKGAALWGAAHPLILGGLGAYALYKILKRRRQRKMAERGYSVVEKMYSSGSLKIAVKEREFALTPAGKRKISDKILARLAPELMWSEEVLDRYGRIQRARMRKGLKEVSGKVFSVKRVIPARAFSEVSDQLEIPMPIPSAPREVVPKKIVKKAKKSGVVQKDAEGNWRVINMHGPNGQAIYWKPKYGSKEKAENALKSYQSGAWSKRK